jgi:hypothetical protein
LQDLRHGSHPIVWLKNPDCGALSASKAARQDEAPGSSEIETGRIGCYFEVLEPLPFIPPVPLLVPPEELDPGVELPDPIPGVVVPLIPLPELPMPPEVMLPPEPVVPDEEPPIAPAPEPPPLAPPPPPAPPPLPPPDWARAAPATHIDTAVAIAKIFIFMILLSIWSLQRLSNLNPLDRRVVPPRYFSLRD